MAGILHRLGQIKKVRRACAGKGCDRIQIFFRNGDHTPDGIFNWETSTPIHGSPDKVRDQMQHLLQTSGCNYAICSFAWGTFTQEQKLHSLRLFTEEVMPAFV